MQDNKINKIAAGIVVYNPNIERLIDNIKNISTQVNRVYIYLNSKIDICTNSINVNNIIVLGNGENVGLAKALNEIMEAACTNGNFEWVITLDQDSIIPPNYVERILPKLSEKNIGIVCPQVIDRRRVYITPNTSGEEQIEMCITSASCTRIAAWKDVGKFDENLFIDLIDNDFCKRLILMNWRILRINDIILDQQFGDIELKSEKIVKFIMFFSKRIKNKNLSVNIAKLTYKKKVSPIRVYYTNRNIIYLNKKYKNFGGIGYECYSCKTYFGFLITFCLASLVRGKNKIQILKSIVKGIIDGKKMKCNIFEVKNNV